MPRLTETAHAAVRAVLGPGETAVDATAGNGHDTAFLAGLVGPGGRVFAFDVQSEALDRTAARLRAAGLTNVVLLRRDHADLAAALPADCEGRVGAVMFNLGYLPGGDKSLKTRAESSRAAVAAALGLVRPGGVVTVVAYPSHPGGADEAAAVRRFVEAVPPGYAAREIPSGNGAGPTLFVFERAPARGETICDREPSGDRWSTDGPGQQGNHEEHQEDEEQDAGDIGRGGVDPAEPEHRRDEGDDQE